MQDPVVIVLPEQDSWQAYVEDRSAGEAFSERYPALEWAHRCAQQHRPSLVRVMTHEGAVEDEWAYGAFRGIRRIGPPEPR